MRSCNRFCFFLALLLFVACQKEKVPELNIPEATLIDVLFDIYIAEVAIQPVFEMDKDSVAHHYYDQIFTIHDVERENFIKDINILRANPELTQDIYQKVIERLKEIEKEGKTNGKEGKTKK